MKVIKVDDSEFGTTGFFTIWVWARDVTWRESPYLFKYKSGQVYFMLGSRQSDKRYIKEAENEKVAVEVATKYLEEWLRYCRAID